MSKSLILGIDPGFTGALVITDNRNQLIKVADMPCLNINKDRLSLFGKAHSKQTIDGKALTDILKPFVGGVNTAVGGLSGGLNGTLTLAVLEQVHAAPDQGVSSMFRFGEGFGMVQGVLHALGVKVITVPPSVWKLKMNVSKDKASSIAKASSIYGPQNAEMYFSRKKDHGRAEAALLSNYGWSFYSGL